jgi:hypothetical protein
LSQSGPGAQYSGPTVTVPSLSLSPSRTPSSNKQAAREAKATRIERDDSHSFLVAVNS